MTYLLIMVAFGCMVAAGGLLLLLVGAQRQLAEVKHHAQATAAKNESLEGYAQVMRSEIDDLRSQCAHEHNEAYRLRRLVAMVPESTMLSLLRARRNVEVHHATTD